MRAISWNGRIAQDLRLVLPMHRGWAAHQPSTGSVRARLQYRNFTELPRGFAVQLAITGETDAAPHPDLAYDPTARPSPAAVNIAMLGYRPAPNLEFSAGRDQLPSGLNVPDRALFISARNRLGYYDAPTQIRTYWAGKRHRITPFVYAPGGNETAGEGESGAGTLAELDVSANQRAVVGLSFRRGSSPKGSRQVAGVYTRLGFGSWGILAQHDVTDREREDVTGSFRQHTSYGQVFWAAREWLVVSAIGERLSVRRPFEERLNAGAIEVTARLTSVATIGATARLQRDTLTRRVSTSMMFQVAFKTVY